eukprot:scaffold162476_cov35-Tisochrysis_lutea.AAC.4
MKLPLFGTIVLYAARTKSGAPSTTADRLYAGASSLAIPAAGLKKSNKRPGASQATFASSLPWGSRSYSM